MKTIKIVKIVDIKDINRGDIIRNIATGISYVAEDCFGDIVIGVRTVRITNPLEWEILREEDKSK